jgi:hypothetical protein
MQITCVFYIARITMLARIANAISVSDIEKLTAVCAVALCVGVWKDRLDMQC